MQRPHRRHEAERTAGRAPVRAEAARRGDVVELDQLHRGAVHGRERAAGARLAATTDAPSTGGDSRFARGAGRERFEPREALAHGDAAREHEPGRRAQRAGGARSRRSSTPRMRHDEPGLVDARVAVEEQVEVERARSVRDARHADAARGALEREERVEQRARRERGRELRRAVQVGALARGAADGLRLEPRRDADEPRARQRGEPATPSRKRARSPRLLPSPT